jgi:hypothetical protein
MKDFERNLEHLIRKGYSAESAFALSKMNAKFNNEKSFSDYPDAVKNNAKKGIELNDKVNNKCATPVGKIRAKQLSKGESITLSTVKRMYSYLSRAEVYYNPDDNKACGTISYLLWGGLAGLRWSESILKQEGEIESK